MNPSSAPTISPQASQFATPEPGDNGASDKLDEKTAESGYDQILDTGWRESEPGTALEIGEHTWRPAERSASLTLAARRG